MPSQLPRQILRVNYEEAAQAYLRSLPLEHFMEATAQATQRKITLESLDLVHARRPEVQVFNELLVQYPLDRGGRKIGQVVPDNMIVVHDTPLDADTSYNLPLQPVRPFVVLEYVSKNNRRKDYDDNMEKYEHDLKVPYYLLFTPDIQELTLYRHKGRKYGTVKPNEHGRLAIPELELEVALLDRWVRYWFRGKLLPLPADLLRDLDQANRRTEETERRAAEAEKRSQADRQALVAAEEELARLREEVKRLRKPRKNGT
jgi:hypothetical protein